MGIVGIHDRVIDDATHEFSQKDQDSSLLVWEDEVLDIWFGLQREGFAYSLTWRECEAAARVVKEFIQDYEFVILVLRIWSIPGDPYGKDEPLGKGVIELA